MTKLQKPAFLRLSLQEAHLVLLAKTLEESADDEAWSVDASRRETLAAARELGESPAASRLLVTRAERVRTVFAEKEAATSGKKLRDVETAQLKRFPIPKLHAAGLTLLLAVLAYLIGAFADRWSADGRIINLLSPPILGILVWNIAIYVALIGRAMFRLVSSGQKENRSISHVPRTWIEAVIRKSAAFKLTRLGRSFAAEMLVMLEPQIRAMATRAFHLAAAAFAAGMLASITVRGIGTAYVVGWESTWFANDPAQMATLLKALYGWLPALSSAPDLSNTAVASMNLATGGAAADPAPWLLALMSLLFVVVILPRLLFAGFLTQRIAANRRTVKLSLDDPYYDAIFETLTPPEQAAVLYLDASLDSSLTAAPERLTAALRESGVARPLCALIDNAERIPCSIWEDNPTERFFARSGRPAFLWLDATATPEAEVHGAALQCLADTATPEKARLLLDLTTLSQRFGATADNVRMRRTLWTRFADHYGVETVVLGGKVPVAASIPSSADPS